MSHIQLENISKLFADNPTDANQALNLLQEGVNSTEVRQRTGVSVGLYDVSITIDKRQLHCVMGLSGSGKSTLIRHINRLIDPTQGKVWVDCLHPRQYQGAEFLPTSASNSSTSNSNSASVNKNGDSKNSMDTDKSANINILSLSESQLQSYRQENISMVFQHFGLIPHMTVLQNVGYGLRVQKMAKAKRDDIARHWLNEVGLTGVENSYPDELSGGMQQRVGLARALAVDTPIILMDEAFSALDPLIRGQLQDQLLSLQDKLNKTIVFITHDIDEAIKLGSHISILNAGRLVQTGTPQALQDNPADSYVEQFMKARG